MEKRYVPATFKFENKPHVMVVEGRFYNDIADLLLQGAMGVLERAGVTYDVFTVPGALEIPSTILYAVKSLNFDAVRRRYDGYIALGCVLKGGTRHDEIVGNESARGLMRVALQHTLAVGNGILTCDTKEQAVERADPLRMNRGAAAAEACLKLVEIKQKFHLSPKHRLVAR